VTHVNDRRATLSHTAPYSNNKRRCPRDDYSHVICCNLPALVQLPWTHSANNLRKRVLGSRVHAATDATTASRDHHNLKRAEIAKRNSDIAGSAKMCRILGRQQTLKFVIFLKFANI
jgi:hypothetical protein